MDLACEQFAEDCSYDDTQYAGTFTGKEALKKMIDSKPFKAAHATQLNNTEWTPYAVIALLFTILAVATGFATPPSSGGARASVGLMAQVGTVLRRSSC